LFSSTMPPCLKVSNPAAAAQEEVGKTNYAAKYQTDRTKTNGSKHVKKKKAVAAEQQQLERPFPWNTFSDTTYTVTGFIILSIIVGPALAIIALSNLLGYPLKYALYDNNKYGRVCLEWLRGIQRKVCQFVGYYILLDPRDSSYLGWMAWGNILQPMLFVWVCHRYRQYGRLEITVFLIYHLMRVGPRHQVFAHHATLVHKEGHASRTGLFCNPLVFWTKGQRVPLSKPFRRCLTDHAIAGIAGILYGTIPNHYATAHNKIHHRWHNDTGDVHTNMDLDRTELRSYLIYLPRFVGYWTGITPALLFAIRGEYKMLRDLLCGMVYYYGVGALIGYQMGLTFYWAYILYPFVEGASFLGIIAYLWHSFSEADDPTNQYINSITILRGGNNVWNEDYHVVHHHEPGVHWSDMPKSFEIHLDKYVECRATVFADCEQGKLIAWMFGSDWDTLADHFVDLQYVFSNGELNKDSNKRMTVQQIVKWEHQYAVDYEQQEEKTVDQEFKPKTEEEISRHQQDVKTMLLRRLQYHYMGTRKDEKASIRKYNDQISANVRDWDEGRKEL